MLERDEETGDTEAKIKALQNRINNHDKRFPMKSFNTKDTDKRKRPDNDVDDRGAGGDGGAKGVCATECAELRAHGYEVEPRDVVDESGTMESFFKVRQPLSTYAPRRRCDARPAGAASHLHRISAVGPEKEIHREESSRAIE